MRPYIFGLITLLGMMSFVHCQSTCSVDVYQASDPRVTLNLVFSAADPSAEWNDLPNQALGYNDNVGGFTFSGEYCHYCRIELYENTEFGGQTEVLNTGSPYTRNLPLNSFWIPRLSSFRIFC